MWTLLTQRWWWVNITTCTVIETMSDIEAREKVERCRQIVDVPTHVVAYMTVHVAVF